jgi:hypothetical protein
VPLGIDRTALVHQLRGHAYCQGADPAAPGDETEMFPRCDQPGVEYGQSWVVATYDGGGRVVKLQRWEKFVDAARGLDRFNELVAGRTRADGPSSAEARSLISAEQSLPAGTRSWVAFREPDSLIGVYLLDPHPPGYANVLEELLLRP